MSLKKRLLLIAVVALLLSGAAFGISNIKTTSKPTPECVPDGQPSSGYAITKEDGTDCPVSSQYVQQLRDYEQPAHLRPARIAMVALALIGIGFGIAGLIVRPKRAKGTKSQPNQSA